MELNKIYNVDCIGQYGMKNIEDKSIDMILIDIPYNISKDNNFKTMKDRKGRTGIDFGEWDKGFNESDLIKFIPKLKSNGSIYIFHSFEQYSIVKDLMESNGMTAKDRNIWEKSNPMPRNRDRRYVNNIEMASWYVKEKSKWIFNRQNDNYDGCVMKYPSESGGGHKRIHPNQKNLKMIESIIGRHSNEGDLVVDFYGGSMVTAVACDNLNRNWICMELDDNYCELGLNRVNENRERLGIDKTEIVRYNNNEKEGI